MRVEISHDIFGEIKWDNGFVSVENGLAERIKWLLDHEDQVADLNDPHTGIQGRLLAILDHIGIAKGVTDVRSEGRNKIPKGAPS